VTLREWFRRLASTIRPRRGDDDLQEELRFHLDLAIEEAQNRGGSTPDAQRAAVRRSGAAAQALDALRDQRELPRLRDAIQDVRYGLRSLRKSPGFAFITVVTLASGLGATTTVFSAVNALFVRPLAVTAPYELFAVRRPAEPRTRFAADFFQTLNESSAVFTDPFASFTFPVTLVASGTGTRASAAFVTPNYFNVLGVRPSAGRFFQPGDAGDVVVISHRLWQRLYGGRSSVPGEIVRIGTADFVVGGVAPPTFGGLQLDLALGVWVQMSASETAVPIRSFRPAVDIVGRLPAGASLSAATAEVNALYDNWRATSATTTPPGQAPLALFSASHGLVSVVREHFRTALGFLLGICACLWLVTIVNVSGLLTARLSERTREMAIRQALGATSFRLFVQLLAEVGLLVASGLSLGYVLAAALSVAIPRWLPAWAGIDLRITPLVLLAAAVTASLSALLIAVIQSVSRHRRSVLSHLAPGLLRFGGSRRLRLSSCLVGLQFALTLPLIVVASLLAQSLHYLTRADMGFERNNLLQIRVEPALVGYGDERASAYYKSLTETLRAVPGVTDAAVSSGGALSGYGGFARIYQDGGYHDVTMNSVDDRYFSTMGIHVLSGRPFDASEARRDVPVVVVNEALARRLFKVSERAIGHVVTVVVGETREQRTIVGVVDNTADADVRDRLTPTAYVPVAQSGLLMVHVRSAIDPARVVETIRRTVTSLDPSVPILRIDTIEGRRQTALQRERLLSVTSVAIGWVALALSGIGLVGHVSRDVVARTSELVIRSVLGATPFQVVSLFLKDTAMILAPSGALGIGAAIAAAHAVRGQVYGVSSTDLASYLAAAVLLIAVAAVATIWPLRRAWQAGQSTQLLRV
jgi:predicted permease